MDWGLIALLMIGVAALVAVYQLDRRRKCRRDRDENRRAVRDYEERHHVV